MINEVIYKYIYLYIYGVEISIVYKMFTIIKCTKKSKTKVVIFFLMRLMVKEIERSKCASVHLYVCAVTDTCPHTRVFMLINIYSNICGT